MKLVTVSQDGAQKAGVWVDGAVLDIAAAEGSGSGIFASVRSIVEGGEAALAKVRKLQSAASVRHMLVSGSFDLLAPIPDPRKNIFCVGRNYMDHVAEGDRTRGVTTSVPKFPQFFTKAPTTLNAPDGDVPYFTKVTQRLDYEVELALIIGKPGSDIRRADAYEHIFGYCVANDYSARDVQRQHEQWFKGKSLDGSLPLGPWLVTADEIGDPTTLALTLTVNGEQRQHAKVSQMIFDIPTIIEMLSAGLTLEAGDIIITGTPSGVGFAMEPPRLLKGGDVVVASIDRIGSLTNRIVEVR